MSLEALEDRMLLNGTILTVTNNDDSGAGSLRAAIAAANQTSGDTITFAGNLVNQLIALTSGELLITSSMTIQGLSGLSISGNNQSRVFDVQSNSAINVTFENLTVTEGFVSSSSVGGAVGGGFLLNNIAGTDTLNNIVVSQNTVEGGVGTTSNNSRTGGTGQAGMGGGIALNPFHNDATAKLILENSTVTNNEAAGGNGGRGGAGGTAGSGGGGNGGDGFGGTGGVGGNGLGGGLYLNGGSVQLTSDFIRLNIAVGLTGGSGGSGGVTAGFRNGPGGNGGAGGDGVGGDSMSTAAMSS